MGKGSIAKIFVVTLLCSLALLLTLFWAYMTSIVLALLIASAFYPLYAWVRKILKGRENLASLMVSVLILMVLIIPAGFFVGTLSKEAVELYGRTRESVSLKKIQEAMQGDSPWVKRFRRAQEKAGVKFSPAEIETMAADAAKNVGLYLSRQLSAAGTNVLSFLLHFFLMMLIIYYIFRDGIRLKNYISELLPFPADQQNLLVRRFRETAKAILFGNGINAIAQGILGGFGFLFFGVGSPILWGTFIAFAAFLPIVGTAIVFVPAAAVLLIQGKEGVALAFLIYNALYSLVMEYGVKPKLIGKEMQMNSLLVFIGILGGMKIFGIVGIIYGPLIMTIFLTLSEIYRQEYRDTLS